MSAPKHTPTPWASKRNTNGVGGKLVEIYGANAGRVATLNWTMNAPVEDAEFIVRACNAHADLLAALERCNRALEFFEKNGRPPQSEFRNCQEDARAALAKARGA